VKGFTLQQDLMPTILELIGLKDEMQALKFDGCSTLPMIRGEKPTNYTEFYITECTWMRKRGWRTSEWKLIEALEPDFHNKPPVELYNLVDDPGENNNLAEKEPELVSFLKSRMMDWVKRRLDETGKPDPIMQYHIGLDRRIGSIATAQKLQAR
jgi:arylsulfatase A-like enzyme